MKNYRVWQAPLKAVICRLMLLMAVLFLSASVAAGADAAPAPALRVADQVMLAIPKSGFGKDYLFSASVIPQEIAATSTALAGKIVRFELFSDGVDMYECNKGLVVTDELPARRLLASFSIVRQDGDQVVIDFNRGMRRVFTQTWTAGGAWMDFGERDQVFEVPESRVFEMRPEDGQLVIRQTVQLRSRHQMQDLEARYEVRYFISPYQPGSFEGKEPSPVDGRYTRYFESDGQIEPVTGRISTRIARFDVKKPVVFYYSANTPDDYVDAVRDGILYWNDAFGKEVVQAKKAPAKVTAPDSRYNIIQWVPWDSAGFAYADLLMDPLTGEGEHGQAYITSAFAFYSKSQARVLLRSMLELADAKGGGKKTGETARFGVPFLAAAPACHVDSEAYAREMAQGLQEVLANDELTDAAVLRASQDVVREVVAHEVGHVLGLRHNFAGSLAATLPRKDLDEWFKLYIAGKPLDAYTNKCTTSSVMEYEMFKSRAFTGWSIRQLKQPMVHDRAAIGWGYFDSQEVREKKLLFATDDDLGRYGDVRLFDYGPDPIVNGYGEIALMLDLLPNSLIEAFIRARAPRNPHDRIPLEQVNLSYTSYAIQLAAQWAQMLAWFNADTRSLRVENQFDYIGELNRKERLEANWKYLNTQVDLLNGVERTYFSLVPADLKVDMKAEPTNAPVSIITRFSATNMTARLEKLLESPAYTNFVGLDDKKYTFSKEDRDLILKRGRKAFEELEKEIVKQLLLRVANAPRTLGAETKGSVGDDDVIAKFEQRLADISRQVIMAKSDTNRIEGKVDKAYVQVQEFKYDQETRLAAAKLLGEKSGSFKGWADDTRSDLNTELKNDVDAQLNLGHFKDFRVSMLSRPLRDWYQQQQELLALLPPAQPPPPAAGSNAPAPPPK
ncbi:MAG: zinc-dependent metalloprotease [Verrucomicrobiota bacterium]